MSDDPDYRSHDPGPGPGARPPSRLGYEEKWRSTGLASFHGPAGASGVADTRMRPVSGSVSFAHDNGHVGFVRAIAMPHASAWFTWCVQGSSGWISHTQPSAHWPQVFTAMA